MTAGAPAVVIIGGGISGLATAHALRARGADVTVLEADPAVGGVIQSTRCAGFLAEHGPNSAQRTPALAALIGALDLDDRCLTAQSAGRRRYIVRGGRPVALPSGPGDFLTSRAFSTRGKLRLALEPFVPRGGAADESVAGFARRRLGTDAFEYAVAPFVSGIYAGDAERLAFAEVFPRLAALERTSGSLVRGMLASMRRGRAAGATPTGGSISFRDGMHTLPRALASALGEAVRIDAPAEAIDRTAAGWRVAVGGAHPGTIDCAAVVNAAPAYAQIAGIPALPAVEYAPVATLTLGFRRSQVADPLDGFGVLVPPREGMALLGVLFNSSVYPGRAPDDAVALTCFLGGSRHPEVVDRQSSADRLSQTLATLGQLLGVRADPIFARETVWERAIPQYTIGYGRVRLAAAETERAHRRLYLTGSHLTGVSVGDCIAGAANVADRVMAELA